MAARCWGRGSKSITLDLQYKDCGAEAALRQGKSAGTLGSVMRYPGFSEAETAP